MIKAFAVQADGTLGLSEAVNLVGSLTGFGALAQVDVFLDVLDDHPLLPAGARRSIGRDLTPDSV